MKTITVIDPALLEDSRDAIGLSARDLAEAAEIRGGASHLRKIERGLVTPKLDVLQRITAALARAELRATAERRAAERGEPMVRRRGELLRR